MPDTDLPLLLSQLIAAQVELFDAADSRLRDEVDIPLVVLLPMRVVRATRNCRVQDLAAGLGLSVGGASKSADRLERGGWLRRISNPADRRSQLLELTAKGLKTAAAGDKVVTAVMRDKLGSKFSAAEVERLSSYIGRLREQ